MKDLTELSKRIYNQNKEIGWWDEPRSFAMIKCLCNSELSEAMEGLRRNLMDDHLPQYEMFWVELADFTVRILDYLGHVDYKHEYFVSIVSPDDCKISCLSFLYDCMTDASRSQPNEARYLFAAAVSALSFAESQGVDLLKIIDEKVEYNKHRADHKRENRGKPGGKEF